MKQKLNYFKHFMLMFVMLFCANLVTAQIAPETQMIQQEVEIEAISTITLDEPQQIIHDEPLQIIHAQVKKDKQTTKLAATPPPLAGVYTIGGGSGDFPSLSEAASYLAIFGVSAPVVFELNDSYDGSSEIFPITFASVEFGQAPSAANPLTIRPALGVTNRVIEGNAAQIFNFNGMDHITIDGRPGGIGTTSQLRITNTSTTNSTIRFINEASHNTVKYCTISGSASNTNVGVIFIGNTTGANGNDDIIITHNIIRGGATMPGSLITNQGTITNAETFNSGINISHNKFINFRTYAIFCNNAAHREWTIHNNSFYLTEALDITSSNQAFSAILINGSSGVDTGGHVITNNYIGGSAAECGGSPMTVTGSGVLRLIQVNGSTNTTTSLQGNTIANINFTSSSNFVHALLLSGNTNYNIGNITGNTLGSQSTTGNIAVTLTGNGSSFSGILFNSSNVAINVSNNTIGGITLQGANGAPSPGRFSGVWHQFAPNSYTFHNNTIGSLTTANSITINGGNTSAYGYISLSPLVGQNITNNTIANISSIGENSNLQAMVLQGGGALNSYFGTYTCTENTIRDINGARNTATNPAGLVTSNVNSTSGSNLFSQNIIYNIRNTNTNALFEAGPIGMLLQFPSSASIQSVVSRNIVHSLSAVSESSIIIGISHAAGTATYHNNMVRLGLDEAGAAITSNQSIFGIVMAGTGSFYNNTVYIGGSGVGEGTLNTYAFSRTSATSIRDLRNNIFVNARSNAEGTGKHYAIRSIGITVNPISIISNHNNYYASGTGGVLGLFQGGEVTDLASLQTETGDDANSVSVLPAFINATGNATNLNLRIDPTVITSLESGGAVISGVTNDFDGEIRQGNPGYTGTGTSYDIGADEFEGTPCSSVTPTFTQVEPICFGAVLTNLPTTSINGISGTWSPAVNNTETTEYTFTPSDGECASTATMTIVVNVCGPTSLRPDFCNTTLQSVDQQFFAIRLTGFNTYVFEVKNMTTNETVTVNRGDSRGFRLTLHAPSIVSYNTVYQVRVKASNANEELPYGAVCTITTPAIHPQITLRTNSCDVTLNALNQVLYSQITPLADEYTFEVKNLTTNITEEVIAESWFFNLSQLSQTPTYDTNYEVRVKSKVNGLYNAYGAYCLVFTPAALKVNLTGLYCGQSFASHRTLYANLVNQAQAYTFEITNAANQTLEVERLVNFFHILYHTNADFYGTGGTFIVRVKVKVNNTYGDYDQACSVFFGTPVLLNHTNGHLSIIDKIDVYPNPFTNEFTVRLNNNNAATVQVFDINGRLVENKQIFDSNEFTMGHALNAGVYLVQVKQNGEVQSFKMIKK